MHTVNQPGGLRPLTASHSGAGCGVCVPSRVPDAPLSPPTALLDLKVPLSQTAGDPWSQRKPEPRAPGSSQRPLGGGFRRRPSSPLRPAAGPRCARVRAPSHSPERRALSPAPAGSRSPAGGSPVLPPQGSPLCWLRTVTQRTEARSTRSAAPVLLARMSPSPLPALLGKVSTTLAHRHGASVLFPARPPPGVQALRTHPRRPGRAPPLSYPGPPPKAPLCA